MVERLGAVVGVFVLLRDCRVVVLRKGVWHEGEWLKGAWHEGEWLKGEGLMEEVGLTGEAVETQ